MEHQKWRWKITFLLRYLIFLSINELISIKVLPNHMTDLRMHPVLNLKYIHRIVTFHHSFKKTLIIVKIQRYPRKNSRWKLVWITNQNQSFTVKHQRNQILNLNWLTGLVNNDSVKTYVRIEDYLVTDWRQRTENQSVVL